MWVYLVLDGTPSPLPDHGCTHCFLLSWPPTQQMIDNSIEKDICFSIFLIMKAFVPLLDTDTLEYFWLNTFYFMDERWKNKNFFFFLSNFQPIHVLLQQLVQWQVENLSSFQVTCFNPQRTGKRAFWGVEIGKWGQISETKQKKKKKPEAN